MAFVNNVVAGTTLVRDAIKSPNYVPGTSGWTINKDGSAEFSDVIVRGELDFGGPNPPNPNGHIGELTDYGYPGFYGLGATSDTSGPTDSTVVIGAGPTYSVMALDPPTPYISYSSETKGEYRGTGHASLTLISPGDTNVAPAFSTMWLDGNTAAEPTTFKTQLYTSAFELISNNMDINGRGVLRDGDSTAQRQLSIKSGSSVVATNASGIASINTGFTTLIMFVAWNGDAVRQNATLANKRTGTGATVDIEWRTANTNALIASTATRTDWIAIGVL